MATIILVVFVCVLTGLLTGRLTRPSSKPALLAGSNYCIGQTIILDDQFARWREKLAGDQIGQNICIIVPCCALVDTRPRNVYPEGPLPAL